MGDFVSLVVRRLGRQERILAQAALDHFRVHGEWPTFGVLERALRKDMLVEQVYYRLNRRFREGFHHLSRELMVQLEPDVILRLEGCEQAYTILVEALPTIEKIYEEADKPEVRSIDFLRHGWDGARIARLGLLFRDQVPFTSGGGWSGAGDWHYGIRPSIQRFAKCRTVKEYLQMRVHDSRRSRRRYRLRRIAEFFAGSQSREPNRLVWRLLVPIVVATVSSLTVWWLTS